MKLKLNNVRLSFESIFEPKGFNGGPEKFSCCFILDKTKNAEDLKQFKAIVKQLQDENYGGKDLPIDRLPIQSGDEKGYDGWIAEDGTPHLIISAANKKRPVVIARDRTPVTQSDAGAPYSGAYVNAIIDLWPMQGQWGDRIVASLEAVQMAADGDQFSGSSVNIESDFDDLTGSDNGKSVEVVSEDVLSF